MTVACILCRGTVHELACARGGCAARQLDLTDHPVDVLKAVAEAMGFPPMSEEAEAAARALCDEMVLPEQLPHVASMVRRATEGWPHA